MERLVSRSADEVWISIQQELAIYSAHRRYSNENTTLQLVLHPADEKWMHAESHVQWNCNWFSYGQCETQNDKNRRCKCNWCKVQTVRPKRKQTMLKFLKELPVKASVVTLANGLWCSAKQIVEKVGCGGSIVETPCKLQQIHLYICRGTPNTLFTKYLSSRKVKLQLHNCFFQEKCIYHGLSSCRNEI
jgi:hypothetical protein